MDCMFVLWLNFIQSLLTSGAFISFLVFILIFFALKEQIKKLLIEIIKSIEKVKYFKFRKVCIEMQDIVHKNITHLSNNLSLPPNNDGKMTINKGETTEKTDSDMFEVLFNSYYDREPTEKERRMAAEIFKIPTNDKDLKEYLDKVL